MRGLHAQCDVYWGLRDVRGLKNPIASALHAASPRGINFYNQHAAVGLELQ